MTDSEGETKQEVLERSGVSDRQLKRWRKRGLVPTPELRSQGHARGMKSVYRSGTAELCAEIDRKRQQVETLEDVGWWLWCEGRDEYTEFVREALLERLDEAEGQVREQQQKVEEEGEDSPLRKARDARDPWGMAWIRGKLGRTAFPTIARIGLEGFAGDLDETEFDFGVPEPVTETIEHAVELVRASKHIDEVSDGEAIQRVLEFFEVFSVPSARDWLKSASQRDLLSIRDEARACFREWEPDRAEEEAVPIRLAGLVYGFRRIYSESPVEEPYREMVNHLLSHPEGQEMGKALQQTTDIDQLIGRD